MLPQKKLIQAIVEQLKVGKDAILVCFIIDETYSQRWIRLGVSDWEYG